MNVRALFLLCGGLGIAAGCADQRSGRVAARGATDCDTHTSSFALHASASPASAPALVTCRYGTGLRAMEPSFGFAKDGAWARSFVPVLTLDTQPCSDNVGEGILGNLAPSP